MATTRIDPTYQPGWYVFGSCMVGASYFGRHRSYAQFALFGIRAFGGQLPGKSNEDDMYQFLRGTQLPDHPNRRPVTPFMCIKARGTWARRAIFTTFRGTQSVRRYGPSVGLQRENLVPSMLKLMEARFIWSLFDDETKRRLDRDADQAGLRCKGYAYFTKLYIQNNPRWQEYV